MSFYYKRQSDKSKKYELLIRGNKSKRKRQYDDSSRGYDDRRSTSSKKKDDYDDSVNNVRLVYYYNKEDLFTTNVKIKSKLNDLMKKEEENFKMPSYIDKDSTIMDLTPKEAIEIINKERSNLVLSKILAHYLLEKNSKVILDVIRIDGRKKVQEWFIKTIETEQNGGLYTNNRRRTPCGVFFHIRKMDRE